MDRDLTWRAVLVLAALSLTAGRAGAETRTVLWPTRACIAAEAEKLDFSGVVSVAGPDGLSTYARGVVAGPASAPITMETRFNLGSAGKMFTAVAVAQLIDAGKIALDDPIGRSVRGLTAEASAVTVRQLLDHSSGLGNYFAPENLPALMKARTLDDVLPLLASDKPQFPPGSRFSYSDTGFLLLGLMIERVSGQPYGEYLGRHVFQVAGMTATVLDPAPPPAGAVGMTAMASPQGALRPAPEAALQGSPAGGVYSTAADMQRFFAALRAGRLTSEASVKLLVSRQIIAAPAANGQPELDYGYGFGDGRFEGRRWFGHNGGAPGVNAETAAFADDGVTLVVLSNRDPPAATKLFRRLRSVMLDPAADTCAGP